MISQLTLCLLCGNGPYQYRHDRNPHVTVFVCLKCGDCRDTQGNSLFPLINDLIERHSITKARERDLRKAAKVWLHDWGYDGYSDICRSPFGGYWYTFCIWMKQELIWNFKEFQIGVDHGRSADPKRQRDDNPFPDWARHQSWDMGYMWGLHLEAQAASEKLLEEEKS